MADLQIEVTEPSGAEDGPWLVLGHSLGTSSRLWSEARRLLERRFRVVSWNLPGHGGAPAAGGPFVMRDLADGVAARLDELGIRRFAYAGVSLGGSVGLELALRHGERIDGVAIISSGANVDAPQVWTARAEAVRSDGTASLAEGSLQRWFAPGTRDARAGRVEEMIDALRAADDHSYAWACEALAAYDARPDLGTVTVPVLTLWGEFDQLVPEQKSAELAQGVNRGTVQCVLGAAHAAPLEQPEVVAEQLIDFLLDP
ncbi:alpha/beta fold hydrolase [Aeromicrobium sp. P5_D10]